MHEIKRTNSDQVWRGIVQTIETKMKLQKLKTQSRQLDINPEWQYQNGKDVAKVYNLRIWIS